MSVFDSAEPGAIPARETRPASELWRRVKALIKWPFYVVYQRRLESKVRTWRLPRHIGLIMDGNRRFARQQGLGNVSAGHFRGAEKLWEVLNWCYEADVSTVTVWSMSLDNFNRSAKEVRALFDLFEEKTRELTNHDDVHQKGIRVRFLGQIELLPESLQTAIREAEAATSGYDRYRLNIAMAYGGREEIASAFRNYLLDNSAVGRSLDEVADEFSASSIERYLYTSGQPEPDLILRTSGEVRLSGFLLWQSTYSEYYFCDTHWPALRKIDLLRALRSYSSRQRRRGR
ncbi:MAG: polyprenyl diphosphate synthase [Acidobacteriota bacterium]|nr:polyprenyl diphosphate synthase [Acidobacteriota bacterium]MDE3263490.1 polyprenyl diphosphate synthase [Acidobacteriota bacterium]